MLSRVTLWTIPWTVIIVKFNYKLINLANIRDLYLVVSCVCNVVWCKVSLRTRVSNRSVRAQTIFIQQDCQTEENCRGKIQLVKSKTDCFCLFFDNSVITGAPPLMSCVRVPCPVPAYYRIARLSSPDWSKGSEIAETELANCSSVTKFKIVKNTSYGFVPSPISANYRAVSAKYNVVHT